MKKNILILLALLLFIYSCNISNHQRETQYLECEINEECIEKWGNGFVCYRNSCKYDYCKTLNGYEACNEGTCYNNFNGYSCRCPEGQYNKSSSYTPNKAFAVDKCITDLSCKKASDCDFLRKGNEYFSVCSATKDKCVTHCINDFDCKGEYAACSNEQPDFNTCTDLKEVYYYFIDNPEYNEYCKDTFFDPYMICGKNCETNDNCKTGFICSLDKTCLPICATNQDCENDKFSNGNICDTELNYCVQ
jgi:hypothetical protein